ncbi:MarR family winged helix-turn-helix transcriptional regulator [Falsiroseomonas ponticola]|uniref:MarR family winged helix-turn-helix transcriptional regulator n=1 Tax=Falsiroseomonas ponticola TaxID=2786951 RepID=UPI00193379D4|nr:MarR family winged helix-turn-helix transcriptional regulator [Roseomonas ponticola]
MSNIASAQKRRTRATAGELRRHAPETLITFRVSVLSQVLARLVDASVGQDLGLSSRQWRVLVMLNRMGPSTSGAVARMASLDHSQVSRASFELAAKGLVVQEGDAADRRRQMLSLTPAGIAVLRDGLGGSLERERRLRACLGEDDYAALGRALAALTAEARIMLEERRGEP